MAMVRRADYVPDCAEDIFTVLKIPKAVPGDVLTVKLKRHHEDFAEAEIVAVSARKGALRNDRLVLCQHFRDCSGCQFQMMPYEDQLSFKQNVIQRAYAYFYPDLNQHQVENFGLVIDSPRQFSYRTKLTPHVTQRKRLTLADIPLPIGFDNVQPECGTVDVQSCPIAVPSINEMIPKLRENFSHTLQSQLEKGLTPKVTPTYIMRDSIRIDHKTGEHTNVCLTEHKKVVTEKVGDFVFQFLANEFFQNNRSILPMYLDFIQHHLLQIKPGFKHLVDAYCGSGFLGISLSKSIPEGGKVFGIEISKPSIEYAKHNAGINGIRMPEQMQFVNGNSDSMFTSEEFAASGVTGGECVVLMNPSRKGSTEAFMKQLVEFQPQAIVYVSCNVFTQARDLAFFEASCQDANVKYAIKSVTGFDFYPQTKHVENVAVLELVTS